MSRPSIGTKANQKVVNQHTKGLFDHRSRISLKKKKKTVFLKGYDSGEI